MPKWRVLLSTAVNKGWGESKKYEIKAPSALIALTLASRRQHRDYRQRSKLTALSASVIKV